MDSADLLQDFRCAYSEQFHYFVQPIALDCGHCICKTCIAQDKTVHSIRCKICNEVTEKDLNKVKETVVAKKAILSHIHQLLVSIEKQFENSLEKLDGRQYIYS